MLRRTAFVLMLAAGAACDDSPTSPSSGFTLTCPPRTTVQTTTATAQVTYAAPASSGGQPPIATSCAPPSGSAFAVGTTIVTCQGTDARGQSDSCHPVIDVARLPTLEATRFLAFGDSITAGEVTVPLSPTLEAPPQLTMVVIPSASAAVTDPGQ